MIQFNLLPDVKLEYIKTRRMQRLVSLVSLLAAGGALFILVVLFLSVQVAQKNHMNDLTKDINSEKGKITAVPDLDKILTVQNQLTSLPDLHSKKPITSRIFNYIQLVTPPQASISELYLDFNTDTLKLTGKSDTLATANRFADTFKFATYKTSKTTTGKPFTNVVTTLSDSDGKATYTIDLTFDPLLFANDETPTLVVPNIVSTRSETEKPAVFTGSSPNQQTGGTR